MSERQNHNEDDDSLDVKASNIYSGGEISGYSPTWRVINPSSSHQEEINNTGNNNLNGKYTIPWYGKHLNFWGHPSKKWYKSPVLLGSSLISIFLIMLISVPAL